MYLKDIKKVYSNGQKKIVFENLSLMLDKGVYVLIGQNGAGKTTLINILSGALLPDKGEILYKGKSVKSDFLYRNVYVVIAGDRALNWRCTVRHNIYYYLMLKGKSKKEINQLLEKNIDKFSKLKLFLDTRLENLSFGQKKTVQLFIGLLSGAEYLAIDEITEGIDIDMRMELLEYITSLNDGNKCFIFSTHDVDFAQRLGGTQVYIHNGKIYAISNDRNQNIVKTYQEMTNMN